MAFGIASGQAGSPAEGDEVDSAVRRNEPGGAGMTQRPADPIGLNGHAHPSSKGIGTDLIVVCRASLKTFVV